MINRGYLATEHTDLKNKGDDQHMTSQVLGMFHWEMDSHLQLPSHGAYGTQKKGDTLIQTGDDSQAYD